MANVLEPVRVLAGVEPVTDKPEAATDHYVFSKGIRFVNGFPERIGGWASLTFNNNETIAGVPRTLFSYLLNSRTRQLIGTNTNLYDVIGTQRTNITPVKTATIAVANSLDTYHATLGSNPIATTNASTTITITDTGHKFQAGDTVTISGSAAVNGIPAGDINIAHFVRSVTTDTYDVIVATAATSTGSGGGAAVVRASGYITVNATAHGLSDGDRVKIAGAATTGGITAAQINLEFIIRNTVTNAFDIYTAGTSTSSVSGGGGGSTTYQEPIETGPADTLLGQGYGAGLYGVGLYGVSKTSSTTNPPRIWSHDKFGQLTISCYNDDSVIYEWGGDTNAAPVAVNNAPTANYVFVSNSILVALGYDGSAVPNGISWSDQGDRTNWTTGQAGSDTIEGAGKFISQANARGTNLLWTDTQTYTFRYIGGQFIWDTDPLEDVGIIAQNARVSADGNIYWMSNNNFHVWRGGNVEVIPSNTSSESTVLRYVFDDINFSQKEKIFAWYNEEYREVWFHYPSLSSNEPDRIAKVNIDDFVWSIDQLPRTAAEYPNIIEQTPYLIDSSGVLYLHENGLNDDGGAFSWQLTSRRIFGGTDMVQLSAIIPDLNLSGSFTMRVTTREYPLSSDLTDKSYTVSSATDRISAEQNGRYWQFDLTGSATDQELEFGIWQQEVQRASPK